MTQMPVGTGSIVASEVPHPEIPGRQSTMMDHATPVAMVSAFCRAVLAIIIPHNCLGTGELQTKNKHVFFRNVDRFIGLKRFETLTLHEMTQGIKVSPKMDIALFPSIFPQSCFSSQANTARSPILSG
jgi:hypothetical protein